MKKFAKKPNLTVLDLKLHVTPIALVSFVWTLVYVILNTVFVLTNIISLDDFLSMAISGTIGFIISAVAFFVLHAIFVTIRYGKKIKAPWYKQVLYCLTFAIFMMLYLPILFVAMFTKPKWEPIEHKDSKLAEKRIAHVRLPWNRKWKKEM